MRMPRCAGCAWAYFPGWMKEAPATDAGSRGAGDGRKLGFTPVEVSLPDWPYDSLDLILFAEAAASFEELTLAGGSISSVAGADAWPNSYPAGRDSSPPWTCANGPLPPHGVAGDGPHLLPGGALLVPSLRDDE